MSGKKPLAPIRFTEHLIWEGFSYPFGVSAADLDGDGNIDLVTADTSGFVQAEAPPGESWPAPVLRSKNPQPHIRNSNLYWFKNDGKGRFTRHFIAENDLARRLERNVIADMNNDGRPDVVVVDNFLGDVLWYENPGPAGLARGDRWAKHYVSKGGIFGAEDLTVADFDGDGYLDVAVAGWRLGNCYKWFKNPGPRSDREWPGWTIDGGFPVARCVVAGDIDGDGRPDLLATSDQSRAILWYENPADPTRQPWRRHVIDLPLPPQEPVFGRLVDMNGDGRLDVLVALGGQWDKARARGSVVWYENAGKADGRVQWKKHIIGQDLPAMSDAVAADLRGNGALDVVAAGSRSGTVSWFENPGDPTGRWTMHPLKRNWRNVNQVIAADLDRDGRVDIAGVADYGSMELRWWRNHGRSGPKFRNDR